MSKLVDGIQAAIQKQQEQDKVLEHTFRKYLEIDAEVNANNVGYQAWARSALAVCMSLSNILLAWKYSDNHRHFRADGELIYGLAAHDFWAKNSSVLAPMLTAAHNAHKDYIALLVERETLKEYATYDQLMSGTQAMPLEIFSMVLYLVGGPMLMATSSLPLKIALAPYFLK